MALNHHRKGQKVEAIVAAGIACGNVERHEPYGLIAQVLDGMEQFDSAAGYWLDARTAARSQAVNRQIYYYYREAWSFLKDRNYEFAYLRSRSALELVDSGHLPKSSTDFEYYEHLRAIRMISSLQHLKGTQGWAAATIDAEWLKANAMVAGLRDLGSGMVGADSARPMIESMMETMSASDLPVDAL